MSKKIISLIIVSSFIFSQISSAAPLSNGFLRPLALSERPLEGDFDGPGAVSRRGILQAGGALMLGHLIGENGSAEERTAGAIPYKSALGVSDQSAALVQKIRASQRRMLTNGGIAAASGSAAAMPPLVSIRL